MNANEAKRDAAAKLAAAGITYGSMRAKSVSFMDLARGAAIFVYVRNPSADISVVRTSVPRPSDGGYILKEE